MKNDSCSHDRNNGHSGKAENNSWLRLGLSNTWPETSNGWENEVEEEEHERQLTLQLLPGSNPTLLSDRRLGSMAIPRPMHFPGEVAAFNPILPKRLQLSKQAEAYHLYEQKFCPVQDVPTSAHAVINSFHRRPTTEQPSYAPFSYSSNVRSASANSMVANPTLESYSGIMQSQCNHKHNVMQSQAMENAQYNHKHEQQELLASSSSRSHRTFLTPPFHYNNAQISGSTTQQLTQPFQHSDPEHSSSFSCERLTVVKTSRSDQIGIWFMLEATANLDEILALPQIQKNYLHVKDGRVRVSVVKKYVAVKLGLESESEVEMRCRGRVVDLEEENMSLQEVRDEVWFCDEEADLSSRRRAMVAGFSSSQHHIMLLTYNRRKCYCSSPHLSHDKTWESTSLTPSLSPN